MDASFHLTYISLGNLGNSKKTVLSAGTFSQTLDLETFTTPSRLCCQQNSSTVELFTTLATVNKRRGWTALA